MSLQSTRWCAAGERIALVPTMGALHQGHWSLVQAAKKEGCKVVVSIFVNPIQFGPKEDFRKYPRNLRADAKLLAKEGADVIFAPSAKAMFPSGFVTSITVGRLSKELCGKFRPGHFDGVATVVAKLFNIVRPDIAYFGEKDFQQCVVIERMTSDLDLNVKIKRMPIVREKDGLAMSSRNRYLSLRGRALAPEIYRALCAVRAVARSGEKNAVKLIGITERALDMVGITHRDYVSIVDGETLKPLKLLKRGAVMAIAARLGSTRLIDNMVLL